jgi:hypothetical protein
VINDIGPDVETGSQRITQMVGSRPDEFATLEDAMAYRRQMSPIVAGRSLDDQRELALGVLRQRPDGRWIWKMDPAYIRQRVERGAPQRPALWPRSRGDVSDPGGVGDGQRRHLRGSGAADGPDATQASWSSCRASGTRRRSSSPRSSPHSSVSCRSQRRAPEKTPPQGGRPLPVVPGPNSHFHR